MAAGVDHEAEPGWSRVGLHLKLSDLLDAEGLHHDDVAVTRVAGRRCTADEAGQARVVGDMERSGRTGGPAGQRGPGQEPARPAQDKLDAMWLVRLTEMGLLRALFVPPKAIRAGEPDVVTYLEPGTRRRNTSSIPGSLTAGAPSRARGR
jgi:hypothetical protein